jgi:hypothetical protein
VRKDDKSLKSKEIPRTTDKSLRTEKAKWFDDPEKLDETSAVDVLQRPSEFNANDIESPKSFDEKNSDETTTDDGSNNANGCKCPADDESAAETSKTSDRTKVCVGDIPVDFVIDAELRKSEGSAALEENNSLSNAERSNSEESKKSNE